MAIDNNAKNINPSGITGDPKGIKPTYESPHMIPLGLSSERLCSLWTRNWPSY